MLAVAPRWKHPAPIELIVEALSPLIGGLSPFLIVWAIYLLTSVLTELYQQRGRRGDHADRHRPCAEPWASTRARWWWP